MKSPCGFLEGSRSLGEGPASGLRQDPMRQGKPMSINRSGHPSRAVTRAAANRGSSAQGGVAGCFETVILDDCGYETLPTRPIAHKAQDYTATDRPAGVIPRGSA